MSQTLTKEQVDKLIELLRKTPEYVDKIKPELANAIFDFLSDEESMELVTEFPKLIMLLNIEKLTQLRTMANPYREPVQSTEEERFMCFSFINLQEKYHRRMLMTSLIAFIYRMLSEHTISSDLLPVNKFVESLKPGKDSETYEEDFTFYEKVKSKYDGQDQWDFKELMYGFLQEYFEFNPDIHVKSSAYASDKNEEVLKNLDDSEVPKRLPPMDTFQRWKRYEHANYEAIRQITDDLYGEKAYLDACFMPYGVSFKTLADAKSYIRKYKREFGLEVHVAKAWNWTFLEAWRGNREKLMLDDEKLAILKGIIENQQEEEKLGRDMLKKRVEKEKRKNIKEAGPDDPGLAKYLKEFAPPVSKQGVNRVLEAKDLGKLESVEEDCPENAIEVNVIELKNKTPDHIGRGGDIEVKKGKFFTETEEVKSVNVIKPGEDPQKSEAKDKLISKTFGDNVDAGTFDL